MGSHWVELRVALIVRTKESSWGVQVLRVMGRSGLGHFWVGTGGPTRAWRFRWPIARSFLFAFFAHLTRSSQKNDIIVVRFYKHAGFDLSWSLQEMSTTFWPSDCWWKDIDLQS